MCERVSEQTPTEMNQNCVQTATLTPGRNDTRDEEDDDGGDDQRGSQAIMVSVQSDARHEEGRDSSSGSLITLSSHILPVITISPRTYLLSLFAAHLHT